MPYITVHDFLEKAASSPRITREEEKECARLMAQGDRAARERIIRHYLPLTASYVRRAPQEHRTLGLVYACLQALEKAADSFDFAQEGETFTHRLSWVLRQTVMHYMVTRRNGE